MRYKGFDVQLLVTGSIGIDTVISPYGQADGVLGGSAVYFAFAACQYIPVRLVGVVGDDFPAEFKQTLASKNIDLAGLEERAGSKTFRWTGKYQDDVNKRDTLSVDLNVLGERGPDVPASFANSDIVFLANSHPALQRELLSKVTKPKLVVCDTMDLWINTEKDSLLETLRMVNGLIINDAEAQMLTGKLNVVEAGESLLGLGPDFVIVKKGEHGALLVTREGPVAIPAFPSKEVRDPTGAGDSFAGGVLGYLAEQGKFDRDAVRRAMVHGTIAASFTIEDFSLRRVEKLTRDEINQRVDGYINMLQFNG